MRKNIYILLLFISTFAFGNEVTKSKICLNMIVKDESRVIRRCLESVKPLIDYWVIVDTGSTDGTQEIIKECMKGVPGELHERKWIDFAHNRNEALELAKNKGDYFLFIDADEQLLFDKKLKMTPLDKDYYVVMVNTGPYTFGRILLVKSGLSWAWHGVIHEGVAAPEAKTFEILKTIENSAVSQDGNRSQDPKKHWKDAQVLEKALEKDPTNSRYVYYLAQEYLGTNEYALALKNYEKRAQMGGSEEEVFFSLYLGGLLQETLGMSSELFINSYCKAFQFCPKRVEPLFHMALYYFKSEDYVLSYILSKYALAIPPWEGVEFKEEGITDYQLEALFADSANKMGSLSEAVAAYQKLLSNEKMPAEMRERLLMILNPK
ncbi:MAG: glycosyltransferase [Parachlamydiaceae bacterium]